MVKVILGYHNNKKIHHKIIQKLIQILVILKKCINPIQLMYINYFIINKLMQSMLDDI